MQKSKLKKRTCPTHTYNKVILYCFDEFCKEDRLICQDCMIKHSAHPSKQLSKENFKKRLQNTQFDNNELLKDLEKVINLFKMELNKLWDYFSKKFDFSINSVNQMDNIQFEQLINQMIKSQEEYQKISESAQEFCDNFIQNMNKTIKDMKLSQNNLSVIGNAKELFNKGHEYYLKKDFEKAINCFDQTLKEDEENINSLFFKSESLRQLGKRKEAMHNIEKILAKDSNFVPALYAKGDNLRLIGQTEEALKYYNRVIELDPKFERVLYFKGQLLNQLENYQESKVVLDQFIKQNPQDLKALYFQGDNLSNLEKFQEAIKYFDQALSIDKDNTDSLGSKGHCLTELKRYDESEECLNLAIKLKPDDQWIIQQLERCKRKRKE